MPTKVARTEGGISVERLTTHKNENYNQPGCNDCSDYRWRSCQESGEIEDCIQRLTWIRLLAIEDILGDDYDLDRLRELVGADRDGRAVVLPCKVGDKIYEIVKHRNSGKVEIIEYFVNAVEASDDGVTVKSHRWRPTSTGLLSQKVPNWVKLPDFWKTVFLTREAAEAALKGEQNESV